MKGKLGKILNAPWWSFIGVAVTIYLSFGIKAGELNYDWVAEATKWTLWLGMFLFAVCAYHFVKKETAKRIDIVNQKIDTIIDLMPGLHERLWVLDSNLNRCLAYIHKDSPDVSCLLWLRTADGFNKISQTNLVKDALKEALTAFKVARLLTSDDLNETHDLLKNLEIDRYKIEIESINSEIKRISNS